MADDLGFDLYDELQDIPAPPPPPPTSAPGPVSVAQAFAPMTQSMDMQQQGMGYADAATTYAPASYAAHMTANDASMAAAYAAASMYTPQASLQQQQQQQQFMASAAPAFNVHEAAKDPNAYFPGKMFVGGLSPDTTDTDLFEYFSYFGPVSAAWIMRDHTTGVSRGFGFVVFADPNTLSNVLEAQSGPMPHQIHGQPLNVKPATARDAPPEQSVDLGKIFIGGLHQQVTEDDLRHRFSEFGQVVEVLLMMDRVTGRPRGFGFVTFTDPTSALQAEERQHDIRFYGKGIEIKQAVPRGVAPPPHAPRGSGERGARTMSPMSDIPTAGGAAVSSSGSTMDPRSLTVTPDMAQMYYDNLMKMLHTQPQMRDQMLHDGVPPDADPIKTRDWLVHYWKNYTQAMIQQQGIAQDSAQGRSMLDWIAEMEREMMSLPVRDKNGSDGGGSANMTDSVDGRGGARRDDSPSRGSTASSSRRRRQRRDRMQRAERSPSRERRRNDDAGERHTPVRGRHRPSSRSPDERATTTAALSRADNELTLVGAAMTGTGPDDDGKPRHRSRSPPREERHRARRSRSRSPRYRARGRR